MHDNWLYSRMHQQELLRKAEQIRLEREARGRRKSIFKWALARLGGLMVAVGEALHRRYAPARPAGTAFFIPQSPHPVANQRMAGWYAGDSSCEREMSEPSRQENALFSTPQSRRHSPSRKKSRG